MQRNNTNFETELSHYYHLHSHDIKNSIESALQYHQYAIYKYMEACLNGDIIPSARGFVINLEKGLGKTIISIAIADLLKKHGYEIIILGPKVLESNYYENLRKLEKLSQQPILAEGQQLKTMHTSNIKFHYVSSNSSNLTMQILKAIYGKNAKESMLLSDAFSHKAIFIEEAHIIFNSVTNGSKQAVDMYHALMSAKDSFVFPITGSLIMNSPFELSPLYNSVLGKHYFPEIEDQFNDKFGSIELLNENKSKLQNMISGLTSYIGVDMLSGDFPIELRTKVIKLEMTGDQLAKYSFAKEAESKEMKLFSAGSGKQGSPFQKNKLSGTYKVRSRQASNGDNKWRWLTNHILKYPRELMKISFPFVHEGGIEDFIEYFSHIVPNYEPIIIDAKGKIHNGPTHLIGKSVDEIFLSEEKLHDQAVAKYMELKKSKSKPVPIELAEERNAAGKISIPLENLEEQVETKIVGSAELDEVKREDESVAQKPKRYYIVFTGEILPEIRDLLVKLFKTYGNRFGDYAHFMLSSGTGGTGLDLFNIRWIIGVSTMWVYESWNQDKARAQRYLGCVDLEDPALNNFQPILLISTEPPSIDPITKEDVSTVSTDEELFKMSLVKDYINKIAVDTARGASIECLAGVSNRKHLCRHCIADNKTLVTGEFWQDIMLPDPCIQFGALAGKTKNIIKASSDELKNFKKIDIQIGIYFKEFYYQESPFTIYEYFVDSELLIKLSPLHPFYKVVEASI